MNKVVLILGILAATLMLTGCPSDEPSGVEPPRPPDFEAPAEPVDE